MTRAHKVVLACLLLAALAVGIALEWQRSHSVTRQAWQGSVSPGELSRSHAFLANQCSTCHTAVKGVDTAKCVSCHADNSALLQRQPTAFHANIQSCVGCHVEHKGALRMPTTMDHALLAGVALEHNRQVASSRDLSAADVETALKLMEKIPKPSEKIIQESAHRNVNARGNADQHKIGKGPPEAALSCASCHATKDRHQGNFGGECLQCHTTTEWTVPTFIHPTPRSTACAQCHTEPPSHNMMHFQMMSQPIARQMNANVKQCFLCHQSTSWNDIKKTGWVKHH